MNVKTLGKQMTRCLSNNSSPSRGQISTVHAVVDSIHVDSCLLFSLQSMPIIFTFVADALK